MGITYVSGGFTSHNLVANTANQVQVLSGGTAISTTVSSGGSQIVFSGGTASDTIVSSGGEYLSGGTATSGTVEAAGTEYVYSGGSAVDTVVSGGGERVYSGGTTSYSTLSNGGNEYVSSGGTTSFTTVSAGGDELVSSGGTTVSTTVSGGGYEYVLSAGTADFTTVSNGGGAYILGGGAASGTVVRNGGQETVSSGGEASGTIISSGGFLYISTGGTASGTVASNGGQEYVYSAGVADFTTVSSGGVEKVYSSGTASGTTVSGGGVETVFFGGTAISTTLRGGSDVATEYVYAGATVSGAIVSSGGYEKISGTASGNVVSSGGFEYVYAGAEASGTIVRGGTEDVNHGGSVSGTIIRSGTEYVNSQGLAAGTTVSSGGLELVNSSGTASGTFVSSGGYEYVSAGGVAVNTMIGAGGTVVLSGGAVASGGIVFAGGGARLEIDGTVMPATPIINFITNTTIDLAGETYSSGGHTTLEANNLLHITGIGSGPLDLQLDPGHNYTGATFSLSADTGSGTNVTTNAPPCYRAGTRIRTGRGEVAIEALRIGERVVLARGDSTTVTWLGHRRVDCRRHPRPHDVWPVRVRPGAFAENQPKSDLFLSPDHGVFIDGVLIPVRYLINGATIAQEPADEVTYWHVELPRHDILLAEGLPCESYLDTGNRGAFENAAGAAMLHPDFALRVWAAEACAGLVWNGAELVAARSLLLERAALLGYALTRDPAVRLHVDGHSLAPTTAGQTHRFAVPARAKSIHLVSRSSAPAHVSDDSDDWRRLGVAVSRIVLDGEPIGLTDARLGAGWHDIEDDGPAPVWRWTDGDAELLLRDGGSLDIDIAITASYWIANEERQQRVA